MQKHLLSKSTFLRSLQCAKSLYLYQYYKNLRDPISANQQALFNRGHEVGELAWQLFPDGIDCRVGNKFNYSGTAEKTQNLIKKGFNTLFEATFQEDRTLAMVDILDQVHDEWYAYEVKSSTKVSQNQILDAALQYYVLNQAGIQLTDFYILHINKKYVRNGSLDIEQFFKKESVFEQVLRHQPMIRENIERSKAILAKDTVPKVEIGEHCTSPYPCDFIGYCWQKVPENSIFELGYLSKQAKFDLFNKGYKKIEDLSNGLDLQKPVQIQVDTYKSQQPYINRENLQRFLDRIIYPVFFMDFEAIMPAVPLFEDTSPYQKIPFQYSLHYLENTNDKLHHREFIAEPGPDPRKRFIDQLLKDTEGEGAILVFEDNLERQVLKSLKKTFPEYKEEINNRLDRIRDLRIPFKNLDYYHPAMKGSFSLKAIYQALVNPGEGEDSDIEHGGIASILYEQLLFEEDPVKTAETKEQLLQYCKEDTLALVRVLNELELVVRDS